MKISRSKLNKLNDILKFNKTPPFDSPYTFIICLFAGYGMASGRTNEDINNPFFPLIEAKLGTLSLPKDDARMEDACEDIKE